jgi:hypothetical protein
MDTLTAPSSGRVRLTRALWIVGGLIWTIVIVGWPLLALSQLVLTPDVRGSAIGDPPTLSDVGFLVFIISVPAAVAFTGLALISSRATTPPSSGSALRTVGLVVLVLALSFVAHMAAQLVGFFFLSELIATIFQLN